MQSLFITPSPFPMRKYIVCMALISLIPSILISAMVAALGLGNQNSPPGFEASGATATQAWMFFLLVVLVGPFLETLLLSFGIWLISWFTHVRAMIAVVSALLWACLHSLMLPTWGLVVFWPFVVFSCAYLTWRQKSWIKAIWVAFCIHALQNLLPGIALAMHVSR
ncbi:MAG: hypothetical protein AMXMBFR82_10940 [Candidatus Hydrogenedentota bacterium]